MFNDTVISAYCRPWTQLFRRHSLIRVSPGVRWKTPKSDKSERTWPRFGTYIERAMAAVRRGGEREELYTLYLSVKVNQRGKIRFFRVSISARAPTVHRRGCVYDGQLLRANAFLYASSAPARRGNTRGRKNDRAPPFARASCARSIHRVSIFSAFSLRAFISSDHSSRSDASGGFYFARRRVWLARLACA